MKWMYNAGLLLLVMSTSSCSMLQRSPKRDFTDGFYIQKTGNEKQIVYVTIADDVLHIQPTIKNSLASVVDTASAGLLYPKERADGIKLRSSFNQYSFDVDFLTMPLKFRPAKQGVPLQLNTNLNGAVYFGYRTDKYYVSYTENPLRKLQRTINHYGFSMGGFTGIGNTFMSPTTTGSTISIEYDGVVWTKGIAGIIAINNFTVGVAIGFDNLLDGNRKSWVYETKPWFGLAFGLNLN